MSSKFEATEVSPDAEAASVRTGVSALRLFRDPDSFDQFLKSRVVSQKRKIWVSFDHYDLWLALIVRFVQVFERLIFVLETGIVYCDSIKL